MYTPDLWAVVKVTREGEDKDFRILGSWYGGYLGGDHWRMSSGVVDYEDHEDYYAFFNHSGSIYICMKSGVGMSGLAAMALQNITAQGCEQNIQVEIIRMEQFLESFKGEPDETETGAGAGDGDQERN